MEIKKYDPIIDPVEAVRYNGENFEEISLWMVAGFGQTVAKYDGEVYITPTVTNNSKQIVNIGDWIVKGIHGFFVVNDIEFRKKYRERTSLVINPGKLGAVTPTGITTTTNRGYNG